MQVIIGDTETETLECAEDLSLAIEDVFDNVDVEIAIDTEVDPVDIDIEVTDFIGKFVLARIHPSCDAPSSINQSISLFPIIQSSFTSMNQLSMIIALQLSRTYWI